MYVQEAFDMKKWLRQNGKIDIWKTEAARIRDILGNRKHRVQASILAGMLALALLGGSVPGTHTPGVMAWWGSLYPQFCFSQTDQKPKISFWLAKALERINSPDGRRAFRTTLFKKWRYIYDR